MISLTSPVETRAHRWRAGVKLGLLCVATVLLFQLDMVLSHVAALMGTLVLYALPGRAFLSVGLGRLWVLWPFVAVVLIYHLLTGDAVNGAKIVLRMITAVALANLVTMTTRLSDMMALVDWAMTPLRRLEVNTKPVGIAMALVIRFTPELARKGQLLSLAWQARAGRKPGWRLVPAFTALALDEAEHVAEALRARGGA